MANLSPDSEVLDAHMTAHHVALLALVRCLEDSGALRPGQYADTLHVAMETGRRELPDMTLAMLHGIREAVIKWRCWIHGGKSSSPSKGLQNALKHGKRSAEMIAFRRAATTFAGRRERWSRISQGSLVALTKAQRKAIETADIVARLEALEEQCTKS